MNVKKQIIVSVTKAMDGEDAVYRFVASSDAVDREGDVLVPDGMLSRDYEKNPVILWMHDWASPPVGRTRKLHRGRRIEIDVVFPKRPADIPAGQWRPDEFRGMVEAGLLNAVSVGADVQENGWRTANRGDIAKYGEGCKRVISKWNLLEVSLVPLPMNQDAVRLAVDRGLVTAKGLEDLGFKFQTAPQPAAAAPVAAASGQHVIRVTVPKHGTEGTITREVMKRLGRIYVN